MMIVTVYDWNRCLQKEMERDGLKHGQEVEMASERVVKLSESYDVLIRTAVNRGVFVYLDAPGRGFRQR